ncbi:MAG TPA: beta-ketoacyl synthase N-terminal-like domain-containing protein, partial [Polyangiales bacterium]|nr:beta-ketoacyl synthase N-terminal-like domain-containing protein [Polyangiales bacterium]
PGDARSPESAWQLLCDGTDPVGSVPPERIALAPNMARHALPAAFLSDIELFDAAFFGTGEREAAAMDPQHRMLLELTWEALERAGIVPSTLAGSRTGVFVSAAPFGYSQLVGEVDAFTVLGNEPSAAAGRLSYFFALSGPSLCVDAACASSLVAACLACDSLRRGEIDLAIVGGANLLLEPLVTEGLLAAGVLSSTTRRCRAFDAAADGYVRGEAGGVLVLRRAADATRAGEPSLALLRGHAVAHGGRANGLGAPSRAAQVEVIRRALASAGIEPHEVDYVEAHGTGTAVGDAVELQAFADTYGTASARRDALRIGSIKANIGHTELAAGVASLIKTVLLLQRAELPPHLHFRQPALGFDWSSSGVAVPQQREPWPSARGTRIAGVNALGMSGTYAHALLESAPAETDRVGDTNGDVPGGTSSPLVVALHAGSEPALRALAAAYADHLQAGGAAERLATTTQQHRERLPVRAAVLANDRAQLQLQLRALARDEVAHPQPVTATPKVAFLYSGLGGQHAGMGAALAARCEVFRAAIADCDRLLAGHLPCSLFDVMRDDDSAAQWLARAAVSQPATFAIQHALTQLWRSWGVVPDVVMGHSLGELAAVQAAGILSLDDALRLAAERGRLMDTLAPGGAMAAVDAPREVVEALLAEFPGALWLAAVNAPNQLVLSGRAAAIDAAGAQLQARGFRARRLPIPVAAHSGLLAPMLDPFEQAAHRATYNAASLPIVSTFSGARSDREMGSARYFREQLRATVEFAQGMATLVAEGVDVFLELGPSAALLGPAAACVELPDKLFLASLSRDRDQLRQMLDAAVELYAAGIALDWRAMPLARGAHDPAVPTYAFQRRRHWLRAKPAMHAVSAAPGSAEGDPVPIGVQAVAQPGATRLLRFPEDEALVRLERMIKDELRKVLVADADAADLERTFGELGLGSLGAVQLRSCVQRWLGKALPASIIHGDTTASELARAAWSYATRAA